MKRYFSIFFLLLLSWIPASAQISASLSGRVADQTSASISDADVVLTNAETGLSRDAHTNSNGRYEFLALPVGRYEIRVTKAGFAEQLRSGILLNVGQDAVANLTLRVGQVHQQVKVEGDAALVAATTQDTTGLVGEKEIKALPLNGRSFDLLHGARPRGL